MNLDENLFGLKVTHLSINNFEKKISYRTKLERKFDEKLVLKMDNSVRYFYGLPS